MKIETISLEDQQVRINVELDTETIEKYKHKAARKIAESSKIPGFRPGKAPYDIVRRNFGDEYIEKNAVDIMLDDMYPKILDEAKIDTSGPGTLEDVTMTSENPKMTFLVPLKPDVELGDYRSIRKDYDLAPVAEEEVQKMVKNLQVSYSVAEPVERAAQVNDLVYFKINATLLNPEEGQDPEIIKDMPYQVIIGDLNPDAETWPYEGFSNELIGLTAEESKVIKYTYSEDSVYDKLRGKQVEFNPTVQSIKSMKLPELNDEFAKSLGEYTSYEDLTSKIRSQLEMNRQKEYDQSFTNQIIEQIVGISTVKYPPNVLEHEMEHVLEALEQDLSEQKMDLETYLKTRELDRSAFMEEEIKPTAKRRLERSLVLDQIAKQEKVELKEEDLQTAVAQTMGQLYNTPGFKKPTSNQKFRQLVDAVSYQTAGQLLDKHIIDLLKNIASGKVPEQATEQLDENKTNDPVSVE